MTPKASGGFTYRAIHQFSQATGDGANPGSAFILDREWQPLWGHPERRQGLRHRF